MAVISRARCSGARVGQTISSVAMWSSVFAGFVCLARADDVGAHCVLHRRREVRPL